MDKTIQKQQQWRHKCRFPDTNTMTGEISQLGNLWLERSLDPFGVSFAFSSGFFGSFPRAFSVSLGGMLAAGFFILLDAGPGGGAGLLSRSPRW